MRPRGPSSKGLPYFLSIRRSVSTPVGKNELVIPAAPRPVEEQTRGVCVLGAGEKGPGTPHEVLWGAECQVDPC